MKYFCSNWTFNDRWEDVVSAFWIRYPNPFSGHVLSEDTISRAIQGDQLLTKRVFFKTSRIPKWGERLVSAKQVPVLEESTVDRASKVMVTHTRNLGFQRLMTIEERCTYRVDPKQSNRGTLLQREAWITCHIKGIATVVQRLTLERCKHHAVNANKGLQFALTRFLARRQQKLGQIHDCA